MKKPDPRISLAGPASLATRAALVSCAVAMALKREDVDGTVKKTVITFVRWKRTLMRATPARQMTESRAVDFELLDGDDVPLIGPAGWRERNRAAGQEGLRVI
jgi:hypothetical protein